MTIAEKGVDELPVLSRYYRDPLSDRQSCTRTKPCVGRRGFYRFFSWFYTK